MPLIIFMRMKKHFRAGSPLLGIRFVISGSGNMGTGVLIAGGFAPADPLNPAAAAHRQAFMEKFKLLLTNQGNCHMIIINQENL